MAKKIKRVQHVDSDGHSLRIMLDYPLSAYRASCGPGELMALKYISSLNDQKVAD